MCSSTSLLQVCLSVCAHLKTELLVANLDNQWVNRRAFWAVASICALMSMSVHSPLQLCNRSLAPSYLPNLTSRVLAVHL